MIILFSVLIAIVLAFLVAFTTIFYRLYKNKMEIKHLVEDRYKIKLTRKGLNEIIDRELITYETKRP